MWEEMSLQGDVINCKGLFEIGINMSSCFTCAVGYQCSAPMTTVVMAGEDRGGGNCLIASLNHGYMLLCFMLFWMITGSAGAWVLGGSGFGSFKRPAPQEVGSQMLSERGIPSAVCRIPLAGSGIPSAIRGTPSDVSGIPFVVRGTPSAVSVIPFVVRGISSAVRGNPSVVHGIPSVMSRP